MSFFLSFYRFFLPSSLVEGKPCLSRPLFVRRHVWRLCVLSALLCGCVLLGRQEAMVWKGWTTKWAIFVPLDVFLRLLNGWGDEKGAKMHSFPVLLHTGCPCVSLNHHYTHVPDLFWILIDPPHALLSCVINEISSPSPLYYHGVTMFVLI